MTVFCGVDVGSLRTPAYVAWLRDKDFFLDLYVPSPTKPLPTFPDWATERVYIAFDAPQGLPEDGSKNRLADRGAKTPTKVLPKNRAELAKWKLYKGLVEAGVEIFWSLYENQFADIFGLKRGRNDRVWAAETYPRWTIQQWWPDLRIPSKTKQPAEYVNAIWPKIKEQGYTCPSVIRPTVDQVDAMLCAMAALSLTFCAKTDHPGKTPIVDAEGRVLREGYIV